MGVVHVPGAVQERLEPMSMCSYRPIPDYATSECMSILYLLDVT